MNTKGVDPQSFWDILVPQNRKSYRELSKPVYKNETPESFKVGKGENLKFDFSAGPGVGYPRWMDEFMKDTGYDIEEMKEYTKEYVPAQYKEDRRRYLNYSDKGYGPFEMLVPMAIDAGKGAINLGTRKVNEAKDYINTLIYALEL